MPPSDAGQRDPDLDGSATQADAAEDAGCTIATPANGDDCCPASANAAIDDDCVPTCGNQVIEADEECDGGGACSPDCRLLFAASLIHRYSFDGTGAGVTDSIGGADGNAVNCQVSQGSISLRAGVNDDHVELPAGLLSGLSAVTFEVWMKWNGGSARQRIFDFGNNDGTSGISFITLEPRAPEGSLECVANFTPTADDDSVDLRLNDRGPLDTSGIHHLAVTYDGSRLALYRDGSLRNAWTQDPGSALSLIDDQHNWLGRSQFSSAPELDGIIYEFRIYDRALIAMELATSYSRGASPQAP